MCSLPFTPNLSPLFFCFCFKNASTFTHPSKSHSQENKLYRKSHTISSPTPIRMTFSSTLQETFLGAKLYWTKDTNAMLSSSESRRKTRAKSSSSTYSTFFLTSIRLNNVRKDHRIPCDIQCPRDLAVIIGTVHTSRKLWDSGNWRRTEKQCKI